MVKKKRSVKTSNFNPKILFLLVLIFLGVIIAFLYIKNSNNNYTNPDQNTSYYDYGGSKVTVNGDISSYAFNEFGHGYSFEFPSSWKFTESVSSTNANTLTINENTDISFSYGRTEQVPEPGNISNQNLTIDGHMAELRESESAYEFYGYRARLIVHDVNYAKRVSSKMLEEINGDFVMVLFTSDSSKTKQAELNDEFKKVYETLKFH